MEEVAAIHYDPGQPRVSNHTLMSLSLLNFYRSLRQNLLELDFYQKRVNWARRYV
jgi:hypothetical protein